MSQASTHIVSGYDTDLTNLTSKLNDLGTLVSEMVEGAMRSFKKRDNELANTIITQDDKANKLQHDIDEDVNRIIALRSPIAPYLRRIISITRIASDLERVGDLAEGIARRTLLLIEEPRIDISKSVHRMGKQVRTQLSGSLDTILKEDPVSALHYWQSDNDIDDLYNSIFRELVAVMMGDPRTIPACAELLFVAKNLERIGDHATNICEAVYFTAKAEQLINDPVILAQRKASREHKAL